MSLPLNRVPLCGAGWSRCELPPFSLSLFSTNVPRLEWKVKTFCAVAMMSILVILYV